MDFTFKFDANAEGILRCVVGLECGGKSSKRIALLDEVTEKNPRLDRKRRTFNGVSRRTNAYGVTAFIRVSIQQLQKLYGNRKRGDKDERI